MQLLPGVKNCGDSFLLRSLSLFISKTQMVIISLLSLCFYMSQRLCSLVAFILNPITAKLLNVSNIAIIM